MLLDLSTKTALCLDDEVLVALNLADTIGDMGFGQVHVAHNLATAEELIKNGNIDLALLDINVGQGETSFDIARALAARGSTVIFASGYGRSELPADLAEVPMIEKPTRPKPLRELILDLL